MAQKAPFLLGGLFLLGILAVGAPVMVGIGGGLAGLGEGMRLGSAEFFADFYADSLSIRAAVIFLPPLLPDEGPAIMFGAGLRGALGQIFRPFAALLGGVVVESRPAQGPVPGWALAGTVGLEWWISPRFGIYFAGSAIFSLRPTPHGTPVYPYFPWSMGVVMTIGGLRADSSSK